MPGLLRLSEEAGRGCEDQRRLDVVLRARRHTVVAEEMGDRPNNADTSSVTSPGEETVNEARAGALALVGSWEFLESMNAVDMALLERSRGRRVVILPTASAPDGPGVAERWIDMGVSHFRALGAQAEGLLALTRQDCFLQQAVEIVDRSNLAYFSGGKPDYLLQTMQGTPLLESVLRLLRRGGVVAGCSAGAMIWGGWVPGRPIAGKLSVWHPALAHLPGSIIAPHFDEMPGWILEALFRFRPKGSYLIGVDGGTALVGRDGSWSVLGTGRVVIRGRGEAQSFAAGQEARLGLEVAGEPRRLRQ